MNSSERSTSLLRQSASLAGSDEVSRAFLRRWVSLCSRALIRDFISATTFSSSSAACAFSPRLVEVSSAVSSCSTTRATMARTAVVPSTSLVWPSNCGSASRTVTTAVRPARMSSFSSLSLPTLSRRALTLELLAEHLEQGLLEAGQVGAALGRGDDVDEGRGPWCRSRCPSAARCRRRTRARPRSGSCGRWSSSTGTVSVKVPGALQPPHVGDGGVGREELDELGDAAVVLEDLLVRAVARRACPAARARRG